MVLGAGRVKCDGTAFKSHSEHGMLTRSQGHITINYFASYHLGFLTQGMGTFSTSSRMGHITLCPTLFSIASHV